MVKENKLFLEELLNKKTKNGKSFNGFTNLIKNAHSSKDSENKQKLINLKNEIEENTKEISEKYEITFGEKIYLYFYEKETIKFCDFCKKNKTKFISFKEGYRKTCSKKCASNLMKQTNEKQNMKKYGVKSHLQRKDIQEKIKETNKEKYGVENVFQSEEIKQKIKETNIKKYGVEYPNQSEKIKEQKKQTNLKRYGVEYQICSQQTKEKIKQTLKKKYNVGNIFQSEKIKQKIKETNIKRYGIENPNQSRFIQNKSIKTNMERYGVENFTFIQIKNFENYNNKEFIQKTFVNNNILDIHELIKYFNISYRCALEQIKKLNITYERKKHIKSKQEICIYNLIKTLTKEKINLNIKSLLNGKELDIYIPEYKLAIEYNGLMFHSFGISKAKMFNDFNQESEHKKDHLKKTEECEKQGIQLLHINENEWLDDRKQKIWKSIIKSKLGVLDNRIYARKCEIKEISTKETKEFLESNHIQGYSISKINLGLYEKESNKLVSVMTFGKPRYNNKADYELIRFCSLINTSVIGGGSKLLKHFQKKYMKQNETLISYGNRRWTYSKENFYTKNQFKFIERTRINYYYFHEKNIYKLSHRSIFMKHKLKKYFIENKNQINYINENETERINMYKNGYRKIYDSGQLVYILTKK